jgi:GTP-binding protein EngB required for normal cell division
LSSTNLKVASGDPTLQEAFQLASTLAARYQLSSVEPLLDSCRSALGADEITVAVVGRFKAGKSSFLNHFLRRPILPVGVVPVTTVVTYVQFGPVERAILRLRDGSQVEISIHEIAGFVSERENPGNHKGVATITVELPALAGLPGLIFVDTPGLESVLAHNTEASLNWLPNVGLALVAVSVDPPLSQQDIELLKNLYRYTPNVSVLLTKVDLLGPDDRAEVLDFIRTQLHKTFSRSPEVLPYSVRPGYEDLRDHLEQKLIREVLGEFGVRWRASVARKLDTLLQETSDYLTLNLKSAELLESEREALKQRVIGEKEVMADVKTELRLIVRNAVGGTRAAAAARLEPHQKEIEVRLLTDLAAEFPAWERSLASLLSSFEDWLDRSLSRELIRISLSERPRLLETPLGKATRMVFRCLQEFRDRLSDSTQRAFGVPLRTSEVELEVQEPRTPDVRVGRIFDRNWELLSPVLPAGLIKASVQRHFVRKIPGLVHTNISRLTSQWEESITAALLNIEKEAGGRLHELIATVERLIENASRDRVPAIKEDLDRIAAARKALSAPP